MVCFASIVLKSLCQSVGAVMALDGVNVADAVVDMQISEWF